MTIKAHFDGKVFVPDKPLNLPKGATVEICYPSASEPAAAVSSPAKFRTGKELAESDVIGMWADRADMKDPVAYVRQLRQSEELWRRQA